MALKFFDRVQAPRHPLPPPSLGRSSRVKQIFSRRRARRLRSPQPLRESNAWALGVIRGNKFDPRLFQGCLYLPICIRGSA